jgi:hypothetical protein
MHKIVILIPKFFSEICYCLIISRWPNNGAAQNRRMITPWHRRSKHKIWEERHNCAGAVLFAVNRELQSVSRLSRLPAPILYEFLSPSLLATSPANFIFLYFVCVTILGDTYKQLAHLCAVFTSLSYALPLNRFVHSIIHCFIHSFIHSAVCPMTGP